MVTWIVVYGNVQLIGSAKKILFLFFCYLPWLRSSLNLPWSGSKSTCPAQSYLADLILSDRAKSLYHAKCDRHLHGDMMSGTQQGLWVRGINSLRFHHYVLASYPLKRNGKCLTLSPPSASQCPYSTRQLVRCSLACSSPPCPYCFPDEIPSEYWPYTWNVVAIVPSLCGITNMQTIIFFNANTRDPLGHKIPVSVRLHHTFDHCKHILLRILNQIALLWFAFLFSGHQVIHWTGIDIFAGSLIPSNSVSSRRLYIFISSPTR